MKQDLAQAGWWVFGPDSLSIQNTSAFPIRHITLEDEKTGRAWTNAFIEVVPINKHGEPIGATWRCLIEDIETSRTVCIRSPKETAPQVLLKESGQIIGFLPRVEVLTLLPRPCIVSTKQSLQGMQFLASTRSLISIEPWGPLRNQLLAFREQQPAWYDLTANFGPQDIEFLGAQLQQALSERLIQPVY